MTSNWLVFLTVWLVNQNIVWGHLTRIISDLKCIKDSRAWWEFPPLTDPLHNLSGRQMSVSKPERAYFEFHFRVTLCHVMTGILGNIYIGLYISVYLSDRAYKTLCFFRLPDLEKYSDKYDLDATYYVEEVGYIKFDTDNSVLSMSRHRPISSGHFVCKSLFIETPHKYEDWYTSLSPNVFLYFANAIMIYAMVYYTGLRHYWHGRSIWDRIDNIKANFKVVYFTYLPIVKCET